MDMSIADELTDDIALELIRREYVKMKGDNVTHVKKVCPNCGHEIECP